MGSSASKRTAIEEKPEPEIDPRKQILLQRKVTVDLLEKLSRCLPTVSNPLGNTLKLNEDTSRHLEWDENLSYLQKWKKLKRDDATIGNLIELLKAAEHKPEEYECLFNISREPRNASTATDLYDERDIHSSPTPSRRINSRLCLPQPSTPPYEQTRSPNMKHIFLPPDFSPPPKTSNEKSFSQWSSPRLDYDVIDNYPSTSEEPKSLQRGSDDVTLHGSYSLENDPDRPPSHGWIDFRNLRHVDQSWPIVDHSLIENGKVGNYLPGITRMDENLVVSDSNKKCLHYFNKSGDLVRSVSTGSSTPGGICRAHGGNLAVCCGREVSLWDQNGRKRSEFGNNFFKWCRGICFDRNNRFIISDTENKTVTIHSDSGQLIASLRLRNGRKFESPYHVALDHKNNILVSDSSKNSVYLFDKNGLFVSTLISSNQENHLNTLMGVGVDCCGDMLVADYGGDKISLYNSNGYFLRNLFPRDQVTRRPVALSMIDQKRMIVTSISGQPLQMFEFV